MAPLVTEILTSPSVVGQTSVGRTKERVDTVFFLATDTPSRSDVGSDAFHDHVHFLNDPGHSRVSHDISLRQPGCVHVVHDVSLLHRRLKFHFSSDVR